MGLRGEKGAGHLRREGIPPLALQRPFSGSSILQKDGEAAGNFQNAYYIEGTELKDRGIFQFRAESQGI